MAKKKKDYEHAHKKWQRLRETWEPVRQEGSAICANERRRPPLFREEDERRKAKLWARVEKRLKEKEKQA